MNPVIAILVIFTTAFPVIAQEYNAGMREELGQYPKRSRNSASQEDFEVKTIKVQNVQGVAPVESTATTSQPIYILQQPTSVPQATMQPTTTVEAASVKESRADQLRKQREEIERQNESKLIERLEEERLASEKEKSDKILGQPSPSPVAVTPVLSSPAPVVLQEPSIAPIQPAQIAEVTTQVEEPAKTEELPTRIRVGGLAGLGSYPSVGNINGAFAGGVTASMLFPEGFDVEANLLFSSYDVKTNDPYFYYNGGRYITNLKQINVLAGANYHILQGRVSPLVGILAGYTRRSYTDKVTFGHPGNNSTGSNAFDAGFLMGVEVAATKRITIGADIRYLMNLTYRTDDPLAYEGAVFGDPIESLNYYFATISLKVSL